MTRRWTGVRRPTEEAALRRLERKRSEPPAGWWRKWNLLGDDWAQEKADEELKMRRLLNFLMSGSNDDEEAEKARRLAEALGLTKNGGDR